MRCDLSDHDGGQFNFEFLSDPTEEDQIVEEIRADLEDLFLNSYLMKGWSHYNAFETSNFDS